MIIISCWLQLDLQQQQHQLTAHLAAQQPGHQDDVLQPAVFDSVRNSLSAQINNNFDKQMNVDSYKRNLSYRLTDDN